MPQLLNGFPEWLIAIGAIALCILALSAVFGIVLERVLRVMSLESLMTHQGDDAARQSDEPRGNA